MLKQDQEIKTATLCIYQGVNPIDYYGIYQVNIYRIGLHEVHNLGINLGNFESIPVLNGGRSCPALLSPPCHLSRRVFFLTQSWHIDGLVETARPLKCYR